MTSFAGKPTVGPGKLALTENARQSSIIPDPRKRCYYLVGDGSGVRRHVRDKVNLGFVDLSLHTIVESDWDTFVTIERALNRLTKADARYSQIVAIHGDLTDVVNSCATGTVGHVDIDLAESFKKTSENILRACVNRRVDNIHLVYSGWSGKNTYMRDTIPERKWVLKMSGNTPTIGPPPSKDGLIALYDTLTFLKRRYNIAHAEVYSGAGGSKSRMIGGVFNRKL